MDWKHNLIDRFFPEIDYQNLWNEATIKLLTSCPIKVRPEKVTNSLCKKLGCSGYWFGPGNRIIQSLFFTWEKYIFLNNRNKKHDRILDILKLNSFLIQQQKSVQVR